MLLFGQGFGVEETQEKEERENLTRLLEICGKTSNSDMWKTHILGTVLWALYVAFDVICAENQQLHSEEIKKQENVLVSLGIKGCEEW